MATAGLVTGELPGGDTDGGEGVVGGEGPEVTVPEQVAARVADVGDAEVEGIGHGREQRERRPHTGFIGFVFRACLNRPVCFQDDAGERTFQVGSRRTTGEQVTAEPVGELNGHGTGHLAGGMAAHAVGDGKEADVVPGQEGVLVSGSMPTQVGDRARCPVHEVCPMLGPDGGRHAACPCRACMRRLKGRTPVLLIASAAVVFGCQRNPEDDAMSSPPPPPAAMIAPVREAMVLEERLARLHAELTLSLRGQLDHRSRMHMLRAEAITDRLLEVNPPIYWLAEGYDIEARLRQIQALADRIVAKMRRSAPREAILADIERLHAMVGELRISMAQAGGREAPPSLDELLAGLVEDSLRATVTEGERGE